MLIHLFAVAYGFAFILIGISHFRSPKTFVEIVPAILPFPLFLVYISGAIEIAGGLAAIYPDTRVFGGRLLALLLICVYPANLYMWTHNVALNGTHFTTQQHILRLLAQILLIAFALVLSGDLVLGEIFT